MKHKRHYLLKKIQRHIKIDLNYLFKSGYWLTIGQSFATISSLIVTALLANFVAPQTFGIYKYVIAAVGLLSIPTLRGLNVAYMQAVSRGHEGGYSKVLKMKIMWGIFGSLLSVILSGYYFLQGNTTLGVAFIVVAPWIPFYETLSLYGNLFSGRKEFKLAAKYFIIARIAPLPVLISAIYFTNNISLILLSYYLPTCIIQYILGRYATSRYPANRSTDPKVILYGKHLSIVGIFNSGMRYFDSILLFTFISAPALAIYALATAPVDQVSAQYKSLANLISPKLSRKSGKEIHQTFYRRLLFTTLLSAGLATLYVIFIPFIFTLIFPLYPESILYAQLLGGVLFFHLINAFLGGIIQSRLDVTPKKLLYWRMIPRLIFIILLFLLVPFYGITGVIISRISQSIATTTTYFIQYYKLIKIERRSE